jgi:hypothetical protein
MTPAIASHKQCVFILVRQYSRHPLGRAMMLGVGCARPIHERGGDGHRSAAFRLQKREIRFGVGGVQGSVGSSMPLQPEGCARMTVAARGGTPVLRPMEGDAPTGWLGLPPGYAAVWGANGLVFALSIMATSLLYYPQNDRVQAKVEPFPVLGIEMKTYRILLGNCEELLNDFIEALFREVCRGQAKLQCIRTSRVSEFVRQGCEDPLDLIVQVPRNLIPEVSAPTPIGLIGEAIRAIHTIKSKRPTPVIAILGLEERARYEPLLLEAGADCVLELPFDPQEVSPAVARLLRFSKRPKHPGGKRWFFAGVLGRGLRRLAQA